MVWFPLTDDVVSSPLVVFAVVLVVVVFVFVVVPSPSAAVVPPFPCAIAVAPPPLAAVVAPPTSAVVGAGLPPSDLVDPLLPVAAVSAVLDMRAVVDLSLAGCVWEEDDLRVAFTAANTASRRLWTSRKSSPIKYE